MGGGNRISVCSEKTHGSITIDYNYNRYVQNPYDVGQPTENIHRTFLCICRLINKFIDYKLINIIYVCVCVYHDHPFKSYGWLHRTTHFATTVNVPSTTCSRYSATRCKVHWCSIVSTFRHVRVTFNTLST